MTTITHKKLCSPVDTPLRCLIRERIGVDDFQKLTYLVGSAARVKDTFRPVVNRRSFCLLPDGGLVT